MADSKEWGWMMVRGKDDIEVHEIPTATCTADVERDVVRDIKKHAEDSEHMKPGNVTKVYCVQKVLAPKITMKVAEVEL